MAEKLGTTGKFPKGKLNASDEGELNIAIAHDAQHTVVINFGKQISWVAMDAVQASTFGLSVLSHAGARIEVNIDDAMINRAKEFFQRPLRDEQDDLWIRALLTFALHGKES